MSLYADYKKEREGKTVIENEHGFIVYSIDGDLAWLEDIYVKPESRRTGEGWKLTDQAKWAAKKAGCTKIYGTCQPGTTGATNSMQAMFAYGFKLHNIRGPLVWLEMEI